MRQGALVQELVPPVGYDLRLVVAAGVVVGAIRRLAAPHEWRTNASLGGSRRKARPVAAASALGIAAAAAIGADLVGVDLLPAGDGYTVIELNGAVDFDDLYSLDGQDVLREAAVALGLLRAPGEATRCSKDGAGPSRPCRERDEDSTPPLETVPPGRPVPNGH